MTIFVRDLLIGEVEFVEGSEELDIDLEDLVFKSGLRFIKLLIYPILSYDML
jgi:hypothetical protein